jgi:dTDP-glucose 4,6-dehydratase
VEGSKAGATIALKLTEKGKILEEGVEAIVNFAAETHVDRSILKSAEFVRTNVLGTLNLLDLARRHKVARLLQISTDEVYGEIQEGSFSENSPLKPSNPYSASKAAAGPMNGTSMVTINMTA